MITTGTEENLLSSRQHRNTNTLKDATIKIILNRQWVCLYDTHGSLRMFVKTTATEESSRKTC